MTHIISLVITSLAMPCPLPVSKAVINQADVDAARALEALQAFLAPGLRSVTREAGKLVGKGARTEAEAVAAEATATGVQSGAAVGSSAPVIMFAGVAVEASVPQDARALEHAPLAAVVVAHATVFHAEAGGGGAVPHLPGMHI